MRSMVALLVWGLATFSNVHAASTEVKEAQAQRNKPIQRCDQLKDKAEYECLQRARERIVQARQQREATTQDGARRADKGEGGTKAPPK